MKFPPEIDSLMWQLAESEDAAALEQFGEKYPDYKVEMTRRLKMVRGLKGARPEKAAKNRDKFMPSPRMRSYGSPRWVMPVVVLGVLGSVVFATIGTMRFVDSLGKKQGSESNEPVSGLVGSGLDQEQLKVGQGNSTTMEQETQAEPLKPQVPPTPFDTRVTVVASRIRLSDALQDIAAQAGVSLEWAPGMPEIEIAVDYRDVPAKDVLQHLGNTFGFSAVPQSTRSALLIPAVDRNRENPVPNVGSSSEAGLPVPGTGVNPILDDFELSPSGE